MSHLPLFFDVNAELTSFHPSGKKEYKRYRVANGNLTKLIRMLCEDDGVRTVYINKPFLRKKEKNIQIWTPPKLMKYNK